MRRAQGLWPAVHSFEGLRRAAFRAARGKRQSRATAAFLERLEPEVLRLSRALAAHAWRPSRARSFVIHDPKRRTITAVPFRDRVVHHALLAPLQPVFERRMIADSFACRPGRGTHAAVRRAQRHLRRFGWSLRLDVASFFGTLHADVVLDTLTRIIKDPDVLRLCGAILGPGSIGVPIGSLTSQWFANVVLDRVDHLVKEELRIPGYVRYMDDFALFDDEPRRLRDAQTRIAAFLTAPLRLRLKDRATRLAPASEGLPFLGFAIHRGTIRLRPATLRRFRWRLRWLDRELRVGRVDAERHRRAVAAVFAHIAHADTLALRRSWLREGSES